MLEDFTHVTTIKTRFADMDIMNHVNNVTFFVYFEIVRLEYFDQVSLLEFKKMGIEGPAVVSQTCNYRGQVFHPSTLRAGARCCRMGEKSITIEYELYVEGSEKLVADGSTVISWVDYKNGTSAPLPEELRERVRSFEGREIPG